MQEIIEIVRPMAPPGFEITESMVASFLGLGAVVNPLEDDLKFYKELSERYKEFLKAAKLDGKRLDPAQAKDGSFELWSYYHLGVPTFSMDLWTLPEVKAEEKEKTGITADTLEAMTSEAFVALGEAKVAAFLKEVGAPADIKPAELHRGRQGRQDDAQADGRHAAADAQAKGRRGRRSEAEGAAGLERQGAGGQGVRRLEAVQAPDPRRRGDRRRRAVRRHHAAAAMLETLLDGQVPWVLTLAEKLARLRIVKTEVDGQGRRRARAGGVGREHGLAPVPDRHGQAEPAVRARRRPVGGKTAGRHVALGQGPDADQGAGGGRKRRS